MLDPETLKRIGELVQIAGLADRINGDAANQVVGKALRVALELLEPDDAEGGVQ